MANKETGEGHGTVAGSRPSPPGGGAFPGFGPAPPAVNDASAAGLAGTASRSDHTHKGVAEVHPASTKVRVGATTAAGIATLLQNIIADWSLAGVRCFAVDGGAGNDANIGYADSADQTAGGIAAATAAAGATALKTIAALELIIPRVGAGRRISVTIRSGTYVDGLTFLNGISGYARVAVQGTETNASAGSTAFAGDANANVFCGAVTVTGLNAGGYNPTGVPTSSVVQMVKAGGGAPGLPAEPAAPLGWRVRFDIATTTVALRGICRPIIKVSGTDTVTVDSPLPAVPVAADVFYIEKAGVIVAATTLNATWGAGLGTAGPSQFGIGGIDFNGLLTVVSGQWVLGLCGCTSYTAEFPGLTVTNNNGSYATVISTATVGGGLRNAGTSTNGTKGGQRYNWTPIVHVGQCELIDPPCNSTIITGVFGAGLAVHGGGLAVASGQLDNTDQIGGGTASSTAPLRIIGPGTSVTVPGGLVLRGTRMLLKLIDITGIGAKPAIRVDGTCQLVFKDLVSGTTGNTDVGLDLTTSRNSTIHLTTTPTVTGVAGNVRLSDGTIVTWAQAAAGIVDPAGNILQGNATSPLRHIVVAAGAVAVTWNNAPAGSPAAPARYAKIPDGAGGFYTFPSLT